MVKEIRWSPKAADNFEEICAFIGKDSEFYASMFAKKINAIVTNIPLFQIQVALFQNTKIQI
jgi:plasmid stabilization system protein ParE